ncbi:hypothetical protein C1N81_32665 [Streptomyces sp. SGAir0957]
MVFFATMAGTPSQMVILHANRAGTINRLQARGNGAHRPIRPSHRLRATDPRASCPGRRPVGPAIRPLPVPAGRPAGISHRTYRHSGHRAQSSAAPGDPAKSGLPPLSGRRTLGPARGTDGAE